MNAAVRTIQVDTVTLHRNHIAGILAEMDRRGIAFHVAGQLAPAYALADSFIRVAGEQAAGMVATPRCNPQELVLGTDQDRALETLERLAEGDRFIVDDERTGRALQHWVDQGVAARDEDGYFLTPAGRTHAETVLG